MKDYYKILQVAPDASTEVIQMAYKALAKKYHPDLNPGQEEAAQEKMKDVNEAYEILSDKDKRWQYDQIYYRQEKTEQKTSCSAPEPPKGAQTHSAQSRGEQTCAAPVDPTPEDKEKTSSGKGCAKTGCGCLVVFVVIFILMGLFGGSSSSDNTDNNASSTMSMPAVSMAASESEDETQMDEPQAPPLESTEQLEYTMEQFVTYGEQYSRTENPYYIDAASRFTNALNTLYGEGASQQVSQTTLKQAMKEAGISGLFIDKLMKMQGEDVLKSNHFHRMDQKVESGIVKTLLGNDVANTYWEVSSKAKADESSEILYYYGGLKKNKADGTGALFQYTTDNGLQLTYVGKFKQGKKAGKGIAFYYDGFLYYIMNSGEYENNFLNGKGIRYRWEDSSSVLAFHLMKFAEYINEIESTKGEAKLVQNLEILMKNKPSVEMMMFAEDSPSTTVDLNVAVVKPFVKYDGTFKDDDYHGKGKWYASKTGALVYDGEWNHKCYNGKGTLYNEDGSVRKEGEFKKEEIDQSLVYNTLEFDVLRMWDKVTLEQLFSTDLDDEATEQKTAAENSNTAASVQSDAIPPEVSGCEKDGTWQKILVEATGSNATLTLWSYRDGQWEKDLSTTAAIGANGLTTDKTEGDHMTPEGTFPICFAFSTKEKNTMLYSKIIKEDSVWVCDPESIYYNTLQSKNDPYKDWADKGGAENMYPKFSKGSSNACICFGFNGDGLSAYSATPYAGSALFIDGVGENGNMNSGYGDIKISGKDMTKLLSYLCENDNPVITIKSAQ